MSGRGTQFEAGRVGIVCISHDPFADYLDRVRDVLDAAS